MKNQKKKNTRNKIRQTKQNAKIITSAKGMVSTQKFNSVF